ncbi:MAG: acyltransferase, partial [Alphaproteobacteria bacterium]
FIPYVAPISPFLIQGWTLNFEMLFYSIFAFALGFRRSIGLIIILGALVIANYLLPKIAPGTRFDTHSTPELFEFGIGVGLGWLRHHVRLWSIGHKTIIVPALICLHLVVARLIPNPIWMPLSATIVVSICALSKDYPARTRVESWLIRGGDSSYGLYLIHGFAIEILNSTGHALATAPLPALPLVLVGGIVLSSAAISILVAFVAADVLHKYFEKRTMRWLRGLVSTLEDRKEPIGGR